MRRIITLHVLMFYLSGAGAADVPLLSGREILSHCVIAGQLAPMPWGVKVTTGDASAIACRAFLGAVNETHSFLVANVGITPHYCLPPKITMDSFAILLEQRSLTTPPGDESAGEYILVAYAAEYPCTEGTMTGMNAFSMTGEALLQACLPLVDMPIDIHDLTAHGERNLCLGYIAGAIDSLAELQPEPAWCLADDHADMGRLVNTVTRYLQTHAEAHAGNAAAVIDAALKETLPCK
jgi:hypothetical protein